MTHSKGIRLLAIWACVGISLLTVACGRADPPVSGTGPSASSTELQTTAVTTAETVTEISYTTVMQTTAAPTTSRVKTTSTTKQTVTTTKPPTTTTTEKEVEYPSKNKISSIGFGMYGVAPDGGWTTTFDDFVTSDWCNTFFVGESELTEALEKAKEHNSQIFVSVGGTLWRHFGGTAKLIDRWQEELDQIIRKAKDSGAYDAFAGFYMDEPLLGGVTHEDLLKATKYMREASGDKRVFICFALSGIAPEEWTTDTASPPITPETGRYITDAAFDVYGSWTEETEKSFRSRTEKMLTRLGNRDDVRVWYIPPVMNYGGRMTEENSIEFLNGVLKLLKEQKNPGGIMGYSYAVALSETDTLGNIGLGDLIKPGMDNGWFKLYDRIQEVGRDICSGKTFGK